MVLLKVHQKGTERIVALCDASLRGKVLRQGEMVLDLERFAGFYGSEKAGPEKIPGELSKATSVNAVGKKAVGLVVKNGLASEKDAVSFGGVPHVQVYRL